MRPWTRTTPATGRPSARTSSSACVYDSDARALYDAIAATDKTLEFVKADHYLTEPAGARAQAADLIAAWVTSRS
jgi:hypothetical protein